MKKNILLCSFFLVLGMAQGFAAGLSGGDQFSTQRIDGQLTVQCSGGNPTYGQAFCRSQILNPGEYSFFVNTKIDADHVTLVATREDGSVSKAKTEEYDSVKGISKKSFNLWISTVFQRPLLGFGKNVIQYKMTKNGSAVESGSFIVNVVNGGSAQCQRMGHYFSSNSSDCSVPQNLCNRYFSDNNFCQ